MESSLAAGLTYGNAADKRAAVTAFKPMSRATPVTDRKAAEVELALSTVGYVDLPSPIRFFCSAAWEIAWSRRRSADPIRRSCC